MNDDGRISEGRNVIPLRIDYRDGALIEMTTDCALRIKMRMAELNMDQAALSNASGLSNSAISQILNLKIKKTRHLPKFAKALRVNMTWLRGDTDQRVDLAGLDEGDLSEEKIAELVADRDFVKNNVDTIRTEGVLTHLFEQKWDAVAIAEIDMAQTVGAYMKGIPIKTKGHVFSREVLSAFTSADGGAVVLVKGIGNAMAPLLTDTDVVFFDTTHRALDCLDAVWLLQYAGTMTVRRARKTTEGIRLMAENQGLPDIVAAEGDVQFFGKLAGVMRRA